MGQYYERTPEGLLAALRRVAAMTAEEQRKYFHDVFIEHSEKNKYEGAIWITLCCDAETIISTADKYMTDWLKKKEMEDRMKVKQLVEDIGAENVLDILKGLAIESGVGDFPGEGDGERGEYQGGVQE